MSQLQGERVFYTEWNFSYVPPAPIEALYVPTPEPSLPTPEETLCTDLFYIPDEERLKQMKASGIYTSIEDFWLEADRPKDKVCYQDDTGTRTLSKMHLSGGTYAFGWICRELVLISLGFDNPGVVPRDNEQYDHLDKRILNQYYKKLSVLHLLVGRSYIEEISSGTARTPWSVGKTGQKLVKRVANHWHELAPCRQPDEAHHYPSDCCGEMA
jgi:hypothetical protein